MAPCTAHRLATVATHRHDPGAALYEEWTIVWGTSACARGSRACACLRIRGCISTSPRLGRHAHGCRLRRGRQDRGPAASRGLSTICIPPSPRRASAKAGKTPTREELAPLAKTNIESLAEFGYFTVAKSNGRQTDFAAPVDYWVEVDDADKIATLHFLLPLKTPVNARTFSFQIYDPTFFVDFSPEKTAAVTMENGKPGCSASIVEPPPLLAEDAAKKDESFYSGLSPGSDFGIKLAARAIVACP